MIRDIVTVLVDATTGRHARGIGTVIDGVVPELDDADIVVDSIRLARTRPGRLLYQRILLPAHLAVLRRRGYRIDRALMLDSYVPLIRPSHDLRYAALVHDVLPLTHPQYWSPVQRAVKRAAFASLRAERPTIFTSSDYNVVEIRRLLGLEARAVDFGCGQLSDAEADARLIETLPDRKTNIVAIGTLEPRKNLLFLIDVFDELAPVLPELELRLVGSGTPAHETALRARVQRSPVRDRIHIGPIRSQAEALTVIASAGALVFPSLAEGFGLPVLEALALGTPVVSTDLPAVRAWAGAAVGVRKRRRCPRVG